MERFLPRFVILSLALLSAAVPTGPEIGARIPDFTAADQNGKPQTFASLRGPHGLMLVFVRSADWWPFCKGQLVELDQQRLEYARRGINVVSISYDSTAVLKNFAERKGIHYPMLSDPDSAVIRAFGILNESVPKGTPTYGIPHPGTYITDENGIVKAKYFEDDFRDRYTASNILWRTFGSTGPVQAIAETPQLRVQLIASDQIARPGARLSLELQIELKPGMHVYAPGVEGGYIPVDWWTEKSKGWKLHDVVWPASVTKLLPAIHETVPVYEAAFRVRRDITIAQPKDLDPLLDAEHKLTVDGAFRYQACDEKECFPPRNIPLEFHLRVDPLDRERVPADLQRK